MSVTCENRAPYNTNLTSAADSIGAEDEASRVRHRPGTATTNSPAAHQTTRTAPMVAAPDAVPTVGCIILPPCASRRLTCAVVAICIHCDYGHTHRGDLVEAVVLRRCPVTRRPYRLAVNRG